MTETVNTLKIKIRMGRNGKGATFLGGWDRGFSIQTNGNLPMTHVFGDSGETYTLSSSWDDRHHFATMFYEIRSHVAEFGSERQKRIMEDVGFLPYQDLSEDDYYYLLENMPPIYGAGGFFLCEALCHTSEGAIHLHIKETAEGYRFAYLPIRATKAPA